MKGWVKALLLIASSSVIADTEIALQGTLTQGSLILGKAPAGSQVFFNEQPLQVSPEGRFVFGIGRDAALQHQLMVKHQNQQQVIPLQFSQREYDIQHITGVAQKYVSPPAEVTARIQSDNQKVRAVRQTLTQDEFIFSSPLKPAEGRISGVYGSQRIFNGEPRNPHYGLDIAAPTGSPVIAPWNGTVLLADDLYFSGLTLIIDHGFGVTSTYMHLSKFTVQPGEQIIQGQKIAEIGATGRVTGPHLDWRLNWFQERLDPALLLPATP
ncbi:M23 family metallopeptidase [Chromatiaceae bacterium AAb-1]|nr:M23 family metallopeptidase [Chromatiaceae bacterium AAb-1]